MLDDDFDEVLSNKHKQEMTMASVKMVVVDHLRALVNRVELNITGSNVADELVCLNAIETLATLYADTLQDSATHGDPEILKAKMNFLFESNSLYTLEQLNADVMSARIKSNRFDTENDFE